MICAFLNTFENLAKCMDFNFFQAVRAKQAAFPTKTPCELSVTSKLLSKIPRYKQVQNLWATSRTTVNSSTQSPNLNSNSKLIPSSWSLWGCCNELQKCRDTPTKKRPFLLQIAPGHRSVRYDTDPRPPSHSKLFLQVLSVVLYC